MNAREMKADLMRARKILSAMRDEQHQAYETTDVVHDYATRSYHHGLYLGLRSAVDVLDNMFPGIEQ